MIRGIVVRRVADIEVNDCKGGNEEGVVSEGERMNRVRVRVGQTTGNDQKM